MFKPVLVYVTVCFWCCFAREREPPTVDIPGQGTIEGKEVSLIRTQRILAFLGIPYAQPPIEELRFQPPVTDPPVSWPGVRPAVDYQQACLQTETDYKAQDLPFLNLLSDLKFNISEDCLYLNIFVPFGAPPTGGFATIVWFHPGNFTTGNPAIWNPYTMVYRQRVIVVTFAWRLNIMGFLTTNDGEAPGNYGLMDQQAALRWTKNNIKLFDGNPDNICLMGYGTGSMSIGLHLINPESKGLFAKVISMSGSILNSDSVKYPDAEDTAILDDIASSFVCTRKPTSELMTCLRRLLGMSLVSQTSNVNWRPLIDKGLSNTTSPFVSEHPRNLFERGEFHKVPTLTGYTNMEDVLSIESLNVDNENVTEDFIPQLLGEIVNKDLPVTNNTENCVYNYDHITDSVMFFYGPSVPIKNADKARKLIADFNTEKYYGASTFLYASLLSKYQPTYVYRFDMKPSTLGVLANIPDWVSVPHLFDLIYVWGIPYWVQLPEHVWDVRDKKTSDIIMSFWTNFAKSSNPTESSIYPIKWDTFTADSPGILIIDRTFNMSDTATMNYKSFEFWNTYYPKVIDIATQCCNATDDASILTSDLFHGYYIYIFLVQICSIFLVYV